jgi:hypothetical protein
VTRTCSFRSILLKIVATATALSAHAGLYVVLAQDAAQKPAASLIVGTLASDRGTTAAIPLYYQAGKDTRLRSLRLELDFVSNSVKFDKAEKGIVAGAQAFDLTVEAKELPPDDKNLTHTRLTVNVALPGVDSQKPLPEGLWAFLNFRIPPDAKPFSIALNPISVSAQDMAKKPVEVAVEAGKIIVSVPDAPLPGCFFFSH